MSFVFFFNQMEIPVYILHVTDSCMAFNCYSPSEAQQDKTFLLQLFNLVTLNWEAIKSPANLIQVDITAIANLHVKAFLIRFT